MVYRVASCLRTYDEAAGFPPSPLGAEHRVAVEVHRAVLRVLVGSGRLQPLLRHGWVVGGRGLSEPRPRLRWVGMTGTAPGRSSSVSSGSWAPIYKPGPPPGQQAERPEWTGIVVEYF